MLKEIKKAFICKKIIILLIVSWQFSNMIYQHGVTKRKWQIPIVGVNQ